MLRKDTIKLFRRFQYYGVLAIALAVITLLIEHFASNTIEMALKYAAYNITYLGGLMIIISISFLIAFEDDYLR